MGEVDILFEGGGRGFRRGQICIEQYRKGPYLATSCSHNSVVIVNSYNQEIMLQLINKQNTLWIKLNVLIQIILCSWAYVLLGWVWVKILKQYKTCIIQVTLIFCHHNSSVWDNVRLHTKYQLSKLVGSALKVGGEKVNLALAKPNNKEQVMCW